MSYHAGGERNLSTESGQREDKNPLKRPLAVERNQVIMKLPLQEQIAGIPMSKRMMPNNYPHAMPTDGNRASTAQHTLGMHCAVQILPSSSAVAHSSPVPSAITNSTSTNNASVMSASNVLPGNLQMAANMAFPQGLQYQLVALQAQAKAEQQQQQQQHAGHAQLLQHMQSAHEQSQALARAQTAAQVRAHAEAQARARIQAVHANQAVQAHVHQQAAAAFTAQQHSLFSGGVTTAHEYYYAHAQRAAAAANLPEYFARLAAQQQYNQVETTASCRSTAPRLLPSTTEQLFLHQQQQQQLLQSTALRQQSQKQRMQIAAVAAAAATVAPKQRQTSPAAIPAPRLPTINASIMANQVLPWAIPLPSLPSASSSSTGIIPLSSLPHQPEVKGINCNNNIAQSTMGPHEDARYHNFIADVMKLEKHISDCLFLPSKVNENTLSEHQQHSANQHSQSQALSLEQTGV